MPTEVHVERVADAEGPVAIEAYAGGRMTGAAVLDSETGDWLVCGEPDLWVRDRDIVAPPRAWEPVDVLPDAAAAETVVSAAAYLVATGRAPVPAGGGQ